MPTSTTILQCLPHTVGVCETTLHAHQYNHSPVPTPYSRCVCETTLHAHQYNYSPVPTPYSTCVRPPCMPTSTTILQCLPHTVRVWDHPACPPVQPFSSAYPIQYVCETTLHAHQYNHSPVPTPYSTCVRPPCMPTSTTILQCLPFHHTATEEEGVYVR